VVQVSSGVYHSLAVLSDGSVWGWGANSYGQLGPGLGLTQTTPAQVQGLTGVFTQVAAAAQFSVALRSDGTVWAWGANSWGQLGRGGTSDHEATPARVLVLNHITKISAAGSFALALRSDGIVFAWGDNVQGQLGNGTTTRSPVPVKIAGLSQVTGIAAGLTSAAATEASSISAVTSVWTWGANYAGQLGNGTTAESSGPAQVTGLTNAKQVSAGYVSSLAIHIVPYLMGS
jgi:alpha-tubulin suppressor-like RCC1 family protein